MNEERDAFHSSGSPKIHNNLLGLAGVQDKIIVSCLTDYSLVCQVLDLLPVVGLIIV